MSISESGRSAARLSPLALAFLVVALLLGVTGGAVAGGLVTGAQIKNGTVTGLDVRDGSLTAVDIKDEARVYGASAGYTSTGFIDDFTANTYTPIVSKAFNVPTSGFLSVTAYVFAEADYSLGEDGYLPYTIQLDGHQVSSHAVLDTNATQFTADGSLSIVLPVSAGAHTLALVARDDASGSFIRERSISAVWSPTGSKSGSALVTRPVHPRAGNR